MEDVKKLDEASKAEELAEPVERVELTDEELDQISGGTFVIINEPAEKLVKDP